MPGYLWGNGSSFICRDSFSEESCADDGGTEKEGGFIVVTRNQIIMGGQNMDGKWGRRGLMVFICQSEMRRGVQIVSFREQL